MWKHKFISMTHLSLHGSWILILHMLFWLLYCLHFKRPVHFRHLWLPSDESLHVKIAWPRSLLFALVCEQSSSNSCLTLELSSTWVSIRRSGKVIWESLFLEWETERFSAPRLDNYHLLVRNLNLMIYKMMKSIVIWLAIVEILKNASVVVGK